MGNALRDNFDDGGCAAEGAESQARKGKGEQSWEKRTSLAVRYWLGFMWNESRGKRATRRNEAQTRLLTPAPMASLVPVSSGWTFSH